MQTKYTTGNKGRSNSDINSTSMRNETKETTHNNKKKKKHDSKEATKTVAQQEEGHRARACMPSHNSNDRLKVGGVRLRVED